MAWQITLGDYPTTVIPYLFLGTSTYLASDFAVQGFPLTILKVLVYGFLYVFAFTTVNQLQSIDEDRTNKPQRPLARGLVTRQWMVRRAVASNTLYLAAGLLLAVPWPTLAWLAMIQLHRVSGLYRHWFFKNIVFISVGAAIEVTATWEIVSVPSALPWLWICVTSLMVGIGCNVQDIRDVAGDRLIGRRTMSISWGESRTRVAMAAFLFAVPVIQYFALPWPRPGFGLLVVLGIPCILIWISASRFLLLRNPKSDHWSYQVFAFWWCSVLLLQPLILVDKVG